MEIKTMANIIRRTEDSRGVKIPTNDINVFLQRMNEAEDVCKFVDGAVDLFRTKGVKTNGA